MHWPSRRTGRSPPPTSRTTSLRAPCAWGRAPEGLAGSLYRNGPAKFRRPGRSATHWFDGDGLIRRFRIADGQANLAARFADTPKRRLETRLGAMVMPGFGTAADPRAELRGPDDANAANTSIIPVGDRIWALWEAGSPFAIDAESLASDGFVTLRPDLKAMPFSAHPRIEPDGRIWNLGMSGDKAIIWRLSSSGVLEDAQLIDLPRASYVHDFTATARHLVIVLQPWIRERHVFPLAISYDWRPETGTQVLIIDKADLSRRRVVELPAFGFFHLGDAWEEADGTIRFDGCFHKDPTFALEGAPGLIDGRNEYAERPELTLVSLHPDGRAALAPAGITAEFPRAAPEIAGLPRRHTVYVGGYGSDRPFARSVGVWDWEAGRADSFDFGARHLVEEFVPAGRYLIGTTLNLAAQATELHVLDTRRVADGPVVSWRSEVALPLSFHGSWLAS